MSKTVEIIASVSEPGGAFVARCDNGAIRIGYLGDFAVTCSSPAFTALASVASALTADELDGAVAEALRRR